MPWMVEPDLVVLMNTSRTCSFSPLFAVTYNEAGPLNLKVEPYRSPRSENGVPGFLAALDAESLKTPVMEESRNMVTPFNLLSRATNSMSLMSSTVVEDGRLIVFETAVWLKVWHASRSRIC